MGCVIFRHPVENSIKYKKFIMTEYSTHLSTTMDFEVLQISQSSPNINICINSWNTDHWAIHLLTNVGNARYYITCRWKNMCCSKPFCNVKVSVSLNEYVMQPLLLVILSTVKRFFQVQKYLHLNVQIIADMKIIGLEIRFQMKNRDQNQKLRKLWELTVWQLFMWLEFKAGD